LECKARELDHYLWLAGMYRKWQENREQRTDTDKLKKSKRHINAEVAELFKVSSIEASALYSGLSLSASEVLTT
jgi:hypothetical protein